MYIYIDKYGAVHRPILLVTPTPVFLFSFDFPLSFSFIFFYRFIDITDRPRDEPVVVASRHHLRAAACELLATCKVLGWCS